MTQRSWTQSLTYSTRLATLVAGFFFACAGPSGVALAARSAWVQTAGGDIRLVMGAAQADGSIPAILEIRLAPGWRTYWTDPGASGIPPEVQVTAKGPGGQDIRFAGLRLPVPKRFDEGDVQYTGYDRPVAFPLLLTRAAPGRSAVIEASVFLGICKSICIPVQATLDLTLAGETTENPLDAVRIRTAFAALPQPPSPDFTVVKATFDAAAHDIVLALRLPDGAGPADVFPAGPSGYAFKLPEITAGADGLTHVRIGVKLPPKTEAPPADGAIRLTVSAGDRAIETPLVFGP